MALAFDIKRTERALRKMPDVYADAEERSLRRRGRAILRESRLQVPVDRGVLQASEFLDTEIKGALVRLILAYTAPYAIFVHEGFATHDPPTKRKFLEDPIKDAASRMRREISADMRALLPKRVR
jgi:hypothetical protein